jgi:hypothetical protein
MWGKKEKKGGFEVGLRLRRAEVEVKTPLEPGRAHTLVSQNAGWPPH